MKIRHSYSAFSVFILGMKFKHIHDDIVKIFWGFFLLHSPVVNLPVIGGKVDQPVIVSQLLFIHLWEELLGKASCIK